MRIENSSVLIAGGASGLGEACARRFQSLGAKVTILDANAESGSAQAAAIGCDFALADVADSDQVADALDGVIARQGALQVLINTAGVGGGGTRVSGRDGPHPLPMFRRMLDVHVIGTFNLLRLGADRMSRTPAGPGGERGVFIATSSIVAQDGSVGMIAYAAAKAAIEGMVLPAARDLGPVGIRVACIAPGSFDTPMWRRGPEEHRQQVLGTQPFPKRAGRPEEYAAMAQHICENEMLNATTVRLDAGLRLHVHGPR